MLLYDLPYRPRPEIPDSVSAPDMTIPSDSIESKPFISHQLEKQDTTQLPADTTTTIPIIDQSDTTIRHTQLPEQVPAFPANDTLVPEQQPIPVISDTIRQAAGDSSYLLSTDTATVPEQSFPDIQAQTRTDSILRADESTQKLSEKVADDTTTTIQEKLSRDDTIVMTAKPGNIGQTDTVSPKPHSLQADTDTIQEVGITFLSTDSTPIATDTTAAQHLLPDVYIPIVEIREGLPSRQRPENAPFRDGSFFSLLLAGLILFVLFIRYRKKIFSWQTDGDSEHHREGNRTKHVIGINAHIRNLFLSYTFVTEGALGIIAFFIYSLPLPFPGGYAVNALLLALPAAFYFLLQQGIFLLLATVFSTDARGREWCDTHIIINLLLGICLFPFVFLSTYLPEIGESCLFLSACLYLLSRILFIIKGVKLFLRDFRCLLYFILYLCTLEIAPLLLIGKMGGLL